jgi:hypothetical protein
MSTKRRKTGIRGRIGILPLFLVLSICGCGDWGDLDFSGGWWGGGGGGGGGGRGEPSRLEVRMTDPADGEFGVELDALLTVRFSQHPDPEEVAKKIKLRRKNGGKVEIDLATDGVIVTVTPIDDLDPARKYVLDIGKIKPLGGGRRMKKPVKVRFTTMTAAAVALEGLEDEPTGERTAHTATLLLSGKVLIAGGFLSGVPTATTEILDPADDTRTAGPTLPEPRVHHTATLLPDGSVLIAGGRVGPGLVPAKSDWIFDPSAGLIAAPSR